MLRLLILLAGLTLYGTALWKVEPFLYRMGCMVAISLIGIPALIAMSAYAIQVVKKNEKSRRSLARIAGWLGIPVALLCSGITPNQLIFERETEKAKIYVERLSPTLETYRAQYGRYPERLNQLPPLPKAPRLFNPLQYNSDGSSYDFWISQPGGFLDRWYYSESGKWRFSS